MWRTERRDAEHRKGEGKAARPTARTVFHPGVIESNLGGGSLAKEELRRFRGVPTSYLTNPIFVDFGILIDRMHRGFERTVVTALERGVQSMDERIALLRQPRRLSRAEIRRIRTLVRMITRKTSAANRGRERFFRKIAAILARESRN